MRIREEPWGNLSKQQKYLETELRKMQTVTKQFSCPDILIFLRFISPFYLYTLCNSLVKLCLEQIHCETAKMEKLEKLGSTIQKQHQREMYMLNPAQTSIHML